MRDLDQFKAKRLKFKEKESDVRQNLVDNMSEGRQLIQKILAKSTKTLMREKDIPMSIFVEKDKARHKVVFCIEFEEQDISNDKDISDALVEASELHSFLELPALENPIKGVN